MNELIVIEKRTVGNEEINSVDARELHGRLGLKSEFANWIKQNIKKLNLVDGVDYATVDNFVNGGKFTPIDYILTLDIGKHIAMMTHTSTAHEIRTYFIEFEKKAKALPAIPQDPILAMLQAVQCVRQEQMTLASQQEVLTVGLIETRTEVAKLKEDMKLENWQQSSIHKAVDHKISLWRELYPSLNIRRAYQATWRHLKEKFQVPRYNEIPSVKYEQALSMVQKLNMSNLAGL
jgi:anti-repressor protein